jgi:hypothetical protein
LRGSAGLTVATVSGVNRPPVDTPSRQPRDQVALRLVRAVLLRVDASLSQKGPLFKQLAVSWAANVAGDTLVAVGLAGTLFFDLPSTEARSKVALYLLLTVAPFVVATPALAAIFGRFPGAYRAVLTSSAALRAGVAAAMAMGMGSLWLFPMAFGMLVLSRLYGISKNALLPVVLPEPVALVSTNALLARLGVYAGAVALPIGAALAGVKPFLALMLAVVFFIFSAFAGLGLPSPRRVRRGFGGPVGALPDADSPGPAHRPGSMRSLRLARLATAGVRLLNGFLLALLAFEFKDTGSFLDFSTLIAGAGIGFGLASYLAPWLERHLKEEPMVVAALAIEAAAAFIAGEFFSLWAAAAVSAAAGLAWGTAKFAFDGLLQSVVRPEKRGGAFTRSETLFQLAWVLGAVLPVSISIDAQLGLAVAGVAALTAQTTFVADLLVSPR